jgi:UPF0271 protein
LAPIFFSASRFDSPESSGRPARRGAGGGSGSALDYNRGIAPFLNIDLGELDDEPEELFALAQVASIACGGHAGDAASIARAVARCAAGGAQVGAHPSYPDRAGFGRRRMTLAPPALADAVAEQCGRLPQAAWLKPHGALYHAADEDETIAGAVLDGAARALARFGVIGPAGGAMAEACRRRGLALAIEGFADRAAREVGGRLVLVPRGEPGALIVDPDLAAENALRLRGRVDTICVHGDTPGAVAIARAVRRVLDG